MSSQILKIVIIFTIFCMWIELGSNAKSISFSDRCYISRHKCDCIRKPRYAVCATNGLTYRNICAVDCHNANCPRNITVSHVGVCGSADEAAADCKNSPCICTRIYSPVCGNDMKTYSNECELRCSQRCFSELRSVYDGVCK